METTKRILAEIKELCRINPSLTSEAIERIADITQSLNMVQPSKKVRIIEPDIKFYRDEIEKHKQEIQQGQNKKSVRRRSEEIKDKCFSYFSNKKTGGKRCLTDEEFWEISSKISRIGEQAVIDLS